MRRHRRNLQNIFPFMESQEKMWIYILENILCLRLNIIMNWSYIMYLHKENRELFRDVILLTSQRLVVSEDIVEKDYYVTLILKKLSFINFCM